MRTTLTLEADLVAALKERARSTGATWKQVVNEAIRQGLEAGAAEPPMPYVTPSTDAGPPRLRDVHSVHDLLAFAEGDDFR